VKVPGLGKLSPWQVGLPHPQRRFPSRRGVTRGFGMKSKNRDSAEARPGLRGRIGDTGSGALHSGLHQGEIDR
jgi:transposase